MGVDQKVGQLAVRRIEPRIKRRAVEAVGFRHGGAIGLQRPYVEIDLGFGRKPGAIELRLHAGDAGLAPCQLFSGDGVTDVIPLVAAILAAQPGGELRVALHPLREFGVEKGSQPRIFADGGCCRGWGGGRCRQQGQRRGEGQSRCSDNGGDRDCTNAFHD